MAAFRTRFPNTTVPNGLQQGRARSGARLVVRVLAVALLVGLGSIVPTVVAPTAAAAFDDLETCSQDPFDDVGTAHPFCAEIAWMSDKGVSTGYADDTFRPGDEVTRQAMAAFMARLAGASLVPCTEAPFTDVGAGHAFCSEIAWMARQGISTGYGDGSFRPGAVVTRQAMAAFMARLMGDEPGDCSVAPFADVTADHGFCGEISWLDGTGVSTGYSDGSFRPGADVTRQAMAAFMARLQVRVVDTGCRDVPSDEVSTPDCVAVHAVLDANPGSHLAAMGWGVGSPCAWEGISCYKGRISRLDLASAGVAELPPEIGVLDSMTTLDLRENELTFLPPEIGRLSGLRTFYLQSNELGSVPPQIGDLPLLVSLSLQDNALRSLPPEIGNLATVSVLNLDGNQLGALPGTIGGMELLSSLNLAGNDLTHLPGQIGQLAHLQVLRAEDNRLQNVPDSLGDLQSLRRLDLRNNEIEVLNHRVGAISTLQYLHLSGNRLSQGIANWLSGLHTADNLIELSVSDGPGGNNCLTLTSRPELVEWIVTFDPNWDECD